MHYDALVQLHVHVHSDFTCEHQGSMQKTRPCIDRHLIDVLKSMGIHSIDNHCPFMFQVSPFEECPFFKRGATVQ